jgi:hypothetical protein
MTVASATTHGRPHASAASGVPLSNHAIMALVEPFSRRGYSVDLPASDRAHGVVVFRPVELPGTPDGRPCLQSTLRLERPHRAKFRLVRTLEASDGQLATMTAEGDDPELLLAVVEQVDPDRQFHVLDATLITRSYEAQAWVADVRSRGSRHGAPPRLTHAEARLGPLRMEAADGDGWACEVRLIAHEGGSVELPMDFLAVLGWGWRPLRPHAPNTWLSRVSVAKRGPKRTAAVEARLDRAVRHVVETISSSPLLFHPRHRSARWRAAFQRTLPLLYVAGLGLGLLLAVLYLPKTRVYHMLLSKLSIVAVAAFVMRDRTYRVEIPGRPRPLDPAQWSSTSTGELSPVPR